MIKEHERIFSQVARQTGYWIFVRQSNKESQRYTNLSGYVPKRFDCKAKTADRNSSKGGWQLAGLVASYEIHPDAFDGKRAADARDSWEKFQSVLNARGSGYAVDENKASKHYGCVTLNANYIYSDYDLWDVVDPRSPSRNFGIVEELHGQTHIRNRLQRKVEDFLRGTPLAQMVQHSGEMQYRAPSDQPIDAFGPNGEVSILLNLHTWKDWCRNKFQGRISIGETYR